MTGVIMLESSLGSVSHDQNRGLLFICVRMFVGLLQSDWTSGIAPHKRVELWVTCCRLPSISSLPHCGNSSRSGGNEKWLGKEKVPVKVSHVTWNAQLNSPDLIALQVLK